MRHPERVEDYLGHIAQAIERATSYLEPLPDFQSLINGDRIDVETRELFVSDIMPHVA